jgi:hypothetical protein
LPPYRTLAAELNFCNAGCQVCGRISQAINGLALAEKRPSEGKKAFTSQAAHNRFAAAQAGMNMPRRSDFSRAARAPPQLFFNFSRPMKSRLPSGTPLLRRMS